MRGLRIVALAGVAAAATFAACAPLLSYDDLSGAPPNEGGGVGADGSHDGALVMDARPADGSIDAADAGDLCVRAKTKIDEWYCEPALEKTSSNPARLWHCLDAAVFDTKDCPFGCFQAPPDKPDLCAYCNFGDGDYCPSEFSDVYVQYAFKDTFVIRCSGGQPLPTPIPCDGGARCVRAAPASHCP